MPELQTKKQSDASRLLVVCGVIILLTGVWLWWHNIFTNPDQVFWKMMGNNLSTVSVTKHVVEDSEGQKIDQYSQLKFGSQNAARNLVTITQTTDAGKSMVKSESIGTLSNDYSRYITIDSSEKTAAGQPYDFSKVTGVWGKSADNQDSTQTVYFRQAALNSVVPFGWLDPGARSSLLDQMKTKRIYNLSGNTQKKKENGKLVYVYTVDINAQAYIAMLQEYVNKLGLDVGQALDPSAYEGIAPIRVDFTVDPYSRQLKKIHYEASNRDEEFMSYGLSDPIAIPGQTIPIEELQNKLQNLQ
jgi:hypothetical protein